MQHLKHRLHARAQKGQGTIEYLGIAVLISVLVGALVTFPIGDRIGQAIEATACKVFHSAQGSDSRTSVKAYGPPTVATITATPVDLVAGDCPLAQKYFAGDGEGSDDGGSEDSGGGSGSDDSSRSYSDTKDGDSNDSGKDDEPEHENPVKGEPADVSPQGYEGPFVRGKDGYVYDNEGNRVPYSNPDNRPEYGEHQVEDVWTQSRNQQLEDIKNGDLPVDENGFVPTELEDNEMYVRDIDGNWRSIKWKPGQSRGGKWDMGHKAGDEFRKTHKRYMDGEISKDEFLEIYRDPENYKVEDPSRNRSHKDEDKSDQE